MVGFTRFEAVTPDINGEYETSGGAQIAIEPTWFPAVENRGEGLFIQLNAQAVKSWLARPAVNQRLIALARGHELWAKRPEEQAPIPGGPVRTAAHALASAYPIALYALRLPREFHSRAGLCRCESQHFGILLYTGSPDAEGTLGGLVQQARHIEDHLAQALRMSALCSNDPVCANHVPGESLESRWLHGAACHGCALVAETSCEMRNDYLDRALVVPILGFPDAAFFGVVSMSDILLDLPSHLRDRLGECT